MLLNEAENKYITDDNYDEIMKSKPEKPKFLNQLEQIVKYEIYCNHNGESSEGIIGDEIKYEVCSSEFLDKFGLGDGEIFRYLIEEDVMKKTDTPSYFGEHIPIDIYNYNSEEFPDITISIIKETILDKEPLFNKYVSCSPSSHNCCRITDSEAPLHELPYKTWYITKKEALTVIYNLFVKYCDVKNVSLDEFLSHFKLYY